LEKKGGFPPKAKKNFRVFLRHGPESERNTKQPEEGKKKNPPLEKKKCFGQKKGISLGGKTHKID